MSAPVQLAVLSRQGGRSTNEDACGHWRSEQSLCCVVADGAGGHGGGDVASRLVVQHIIGQASLAPLTAADEVHDLLVDTNAALLRQQSQSSSKSASDMRSTVVALFIDLVRNEAVWGHAGDSRLYLFRDGAVVSQTRDHSFVQAMVDAGLLMPQQMITHPRRSELQSALGCHPEELLVSTQERPWPLQQHDAFLLCSDGLWEYVDADEMCASLHEADGPDGWLRALEELVLQHAAEAGKSRHDNFSGIALFIGPH
jgi:PPM family protein phosphatase